MKPPKGQSCLLKDIILVCSSSLSLSLSLDDRSNKSFVYFQQPIENAGPDIVHQTTTTGNTRKPIDAGWLAAE